MAMMGSTSENDILITEDEAYEALRPMASTRSDPTSDPIEDDWWEQHSRQTPESWSDITSIMWHSMSTTSKAVSSLGFKNLAFGCMALAQKHATESDKIEGQEVQVDAQELDFWLHYLRLAKSASLVDEDALIRELCAEDDGSIELIHFKPKADALVPSYFIIAEHQRRSITLVVRGTNSFKDLLTNVCAHCEPFDGGGYVHYGMLQSCRNILSTEMGNFQELLLSWAGYELHFVGHSLGGGTAALMATTLRSTPALLARLGNPHVHATTIGCPPVMTYELALSCVPYVRSMVCDHDMVARTSVLSISKLGLEMEACKDEVLSRSEGARVINGSLDVAMGAAASIGRLWAQRVANARAGAETPSSRSGNASEVQSSQADAASSSRGAGGGALGCPTQRGAAPNANLAKASAGVLGWLGNSFSAWGDRMKESGNTGAAAMAASAAGRAVAAAAAAMVEAQSAGVEARERAESELIAASTPPPDQDDLLQKQMEAEASAPPLPPDLNDPLVQKQMEANASAPPLHQAQLHAPLSGKGFPSGGGGGAGHPEGGGGGGGGGGALSGKTSLLPADDWVVVSPDSTSAAMGEKYPTGARATAAAIAAMLGEAPPGPPPSAGEMGGLQPPQQTQQAAVQMQQTTVQMQWLPEAPSVEEYAAPSAPTPPPGAPSSYYPPIPSADLPPPSPLSTTGGPTPHCAVLGGGLPPRAAAEKGGGVGGEGKGGARGAGGAVFRSGVNAGPECPFTQSPLYSAPPSETSLTESGSAAKNTVNWSAASVDGAVMQKMAAAAAAIAGVVQPVIEAKNAADATTSSRRASQYKVVVHEAPSASREGSRTDEEEGKGGVKDGVKDGGKEGGKGGSDHNAFEEQEQHPFYSPGELMYLYTQPPKSGYSLLRGYPAQRFQRLLLKKSMLKDHMIDTYICAFTNAYESQHKL